MSLARDVSAWKYSEYSLFIISLVNASGELDKNGCCHACICFAICACQILRSSGVEAEKDGACKNGAGLSYSIGHPDPLLCHTSKTTSVVWMAHFNSPELSAGYVISYEVMRLLGAARSS